jgi:hypothetical protein
MKRGRFIRYNNYAEIKMAFPDGGFHITSICHGCVNGVTSDRKKMRAIYDVDMNIMIDDCPELAEFIRVGDPRCVIVDFKRRGII